MIRVLALLVRRPDLSREAFRDHYERTHAPLALPLLGDGVRHYLRNHVVPGLDAERCPFDVLSEFGYADGPAMKGVFARLTAPDAEAEAVRADELRFLDKPRNTFFRIERVGAAADGAADAPQPGLGPRTALISRARAPADTGATVAAHVDAARGLAAFATAVRTFRIDAPGDDPAHAAITFAQFASPEDTGRALDAWPSDGLDTLRLNLVAQASRTDPAWGRRDD